MDTGTNAMERTPEYKAMMAVLWSMHLMHNLWEDWEDNFLHFLGLYDA